MARNDWNGRQFPHPDGRRPVVGDLATIDRHRPIQSMLEASRELGPIWELKVLRQRLVFVGTAALTAELCDETRFCKALPPAVDALRDYAGDGLFTAYNEEPNWQLAHELLAPAFTKSAMRSYHPLMIETATELFDYWQQRLADGPVDVSRDMTKLTMETLTRTAFSQDFGSFRSAEPHPFVAAMVTALETGRRKGTVRTIPGGSALAWLLDRRFARHQDYVDTMLDELITARTGTDDQHDLLGIMLNVAHPETGEKLSPINIRYQILTFLVAGHETTSGALSFALHYLARNPECLARARAEADEMLGDDPTAMPEFEQVAKFRYIRRVLDESLRIWPTVPGFGRGPRGSTTLGGEYAMDTDDYAVVSLGAVHKDPAVWDEPDRFDPDRFLPENVKKRPPHSYRPFGAGLRSCIGRQFAIHEAVLVLATMLHRFDLEADPDYDLRVTERLTMLPEGFELTLRPRTRAAVPNA
ncbi:cytochrome P450 [Williamsia deligens]|uniref:Cytochrome P450 n=1 Tax=Williamsia deligens TaxID=321325 RepID=A0ABW3G4D7_9NOCA|nr:cytochrome P450 [Williamsia deligens]MCP2194363.1 unspecific monooxygenase [Williamsia deligens]